LIIDFQKPGSPPAQALLSTPGEWWIPDLSETVLLPILMFTEIDWPWLIFVIGLDPLVMQGNRYSCRDQNIPENDCV